MSGHVVYLAGPMTGYPEDNYPLFNETAARLRAWGWDVLNPAETFGGDRTRALEEYMRADTEMLMKADCVALLEDWENSEGARFEVLIAQKRGMPIYDARSMALINDSIPTIVTAIGDPIAELTAEAQANGEYETFEEYDNFPPPLEIKGGSHEIEQMGADETIIRTMVETQAMGPDEAIALFRKYYQGNVVDLGIDLPPAEPETILEEAQRLVYGDRQASYGHPYTDYQTTSRLWEAILELPEGTIGPHKAALMMALMKISRESRKHKRDNLVDTAGYAACADRIARRQAGEE